MSEDSKKAICLQLFSARKCESEVFGYLLTMTTLRCSHYTFYIHIVNEFSILSSGATSPRVGGLIDSRRHVRAESLLRCNILSALARSLSSFG